jgi:hypothetical protein
MPDPSTHSTRAWWHWPYLLGLDGVIVALLWQALLARDHQVRVGWQMSLVLALCTWLIYGLDRWADSRTADGAGLTERHTFLWRQHPRMAWLLAFAALPPLVWLGLWQLPQVAFWHGLAIILGVVVYLCTYSLAPQGRVQSVIVSMTALIALVIVSQLEIAFVMQLMLSLFILGFMCSLAFSSLRPRVQRLLPKELFASLLFTLGCSLSAHLGALADHSLLCPETVMAWVCFLLNLGITAAAEHTAGQADASATGVAQRWQTGNVVLTAVVLVGYCLHLLWGPGGTAYHVTIAITGVALLVIGLRHREPQLQRALADLGLCLPAAGYLLWRMV